MSIWTNIKKRGFTDIIRPVKWWMFLKSLFTKKETVEELQAYIEQVIYRQSFPDCRACRLKGECIHCGCKTDDLFHDRLMVDSGGNWTEMISAEEWRKKKEEEGFEIGIKFI